MAKQAAPQPRPQDALSSLLGSLGFGVMARQVLREERHDFLVLYAAVVLKHAPERRQAAIRERLRILGLLGEG